MPNRPVQNAMAVYNVASNDKTDINIGNTINAAKSFFDAGAK